MRLATFRIAPPAGGGDPAELTVTRAGGSTEANVSRWLGQFDAPSRVRAKHERRTVGGLGVTIVEVDGTFMGGGMMGTPEAAKGDWALLGAIVETGGLSYFFKMTGPKAVVFGARRDFDALIASLKKKV